MILIGPSLSSSVWLRQLRNCQARGHCDCQTFPASCPWDRQWEELPSSPASKLRKTRLPQKHCPIIFWITFPATRVRGKKVIKNRNSNTLHSPTGAFSQLSWLQPVEFRQPEPWMFLTVSDWMYTNLSQKYFYILEERNHNSVKLSLFSTPAGSALLPCYRHSLNNTNWYLLMAAKLLCC